MTTIFKDKLEKLLMSAGITVNGSQPWDIRVHDERFYRRVITEAHLGIGESYMDGWWDCDALDEFFYRVLRSKLQTQVANLPRTVNNLIGKALNLQSASRAWTVGKTHYDIGNDLYEAMLDKNMQYSCGLWKDATGLDEAQQNKLRLVFDKLMLKPGMKILDIGCGWGGAARFAVEKYDVEVTGVTIGMFEHIGHKNYRRYVEIVRNCLAPDGLFLLHTIGSNRTGTNTDKWTSKYIFPNSMLPSAKHIAEAAEELLMLEDWHAFGHDYYRTLMAWYDNVTKHRPKLSSQYDDRFFRMWHYYLLSAAGSFRARNVQLWQVLFSLNGIEGAYSTPR